MLEYYHRQLRVKMLTLSAMISKHLSILTSINKNSTIDNKVSNAQMTCASPLRNILGNDLSLCNITLKWVKFYLKGKNRLKAAWDTRSKLWPFLYFIASVNVEITVCFQGSHRASEAINLDWTLFAVMLNYNRESGRSKKHRETITEVHSLSNSILGCVTDRTPPQRANISPVPVGDDVIRWWCNWRAAGCGGWGGPTV